MSKRALFLRLACFLAVYLLFYALPFLVLRLIPLARLPGSVGDWCFILPAWAFPFDKMSWENDRSYYIFSEVTGWLITVVYLASLGILFSRLTRRFQKLRWIIPLALCYAAPSIFILNIALMACGISVYINAP
jgi:hypothetical protein